MARLATINFESNGLPTGVTVSALTKGVSITQSNPISGNYSLRYNPVNYQYATVSYTFSTPNIKGPVYYRMNIRLNSYPSDAIKLFGIFDSNGIILGSVVLNESGVLFILAADGITQKGNIPDSMILKFGRIYTLEFMIDSTNVLLLAYKAKLDGYQFCDSTFDTSLLDTIAGQQNMWIADHHAGTTSVDLNIDNIAVNDSTGNTDNTWVGVNNNTMAAWSGLGINYGAYNTTGVSAPYDATQVTADLTYLKAVGFTKVRVSLPTYTQSTPIANAKAIIAIAKTLGFYVVWGVTSGGSGALTSGNYATFDAAVQTNATWAQANSVDEFQIGNEELLNIDGSLNQGTLSTNLKATATTIQGIFTRGPVTYAEVEGYGAGSPTQWWIDNGKGDLDKIGFNIYANSQATFNQYVDLLMANFTSGADTTIYEWSDDNNRRAALFAGTITEDNWAREIGRRLAYLKATVGTKFPCYFYTFRWDQTLAARANWSSENTTNLLRPAWYNVIEKRWETF